MQSPAQPEQPLVPDPAVAPEADGPPAAAHPTWPGVPSPRRTPIDPDSVNGRLLCGGSVRRGLTLGRCLGGGTQSRLARLFLGRLAGFFLASGGLFRRGEYRDLLLLAALRFAAGVVAGQLLQGQFPRCLFGLRQRATGAGRRLGRWCLGTRCGSATTGRTLHAG